MENRAYSFLFLGVMVVICLGAYVAVSALTDSSDPLVRVALGTNSPTATASHNATIAVGTRTPTPTNTPFVLVIPTIIFPTATTTPSPTPTATNTPTLPPFPSPRPIPTDTPTATPAPSNTPPPPPTDTPPRLFDPIPTGFPAVTNPTFVLAGDPSVDTSRNCSGQYYIFGYVRDGQGQGVANVRMGFFHKWPMPATVYDVTRSGSEAGRYEYTAGTSSNEFQIAIVDANDQPLSTGVQLITSKYDQGKCWYQLNWKKVR
jgi:hypothetical protein